MSAANKPVMLELDNVSLNFRASKGSFDDGVHHVLDKVSFKLYENETLGRKIRGGETQKVPYLLIVGEKEVSDNTVSVRRHGKGDLGSMELDTIVKTIHDDIISRS